MYRRSRNPARFLIAFLMAPLPSVGLVGCGQQGAGGDATGGASTGTSPAPASGGAVDSSGASGAGTGESGASGAATAAGALIEDTVITTKLKAALLADATLKGASISVETRNGEVVLTGTVNSQGQREHAAQTARALSGVKNVNNKLAMKQ
ncbi:MAG: BON domain-containing protein [Herminiimonas sp.]|nr:BON domain-containing protein [Herminiimonas sp.]